MRFFDLHCDTLYEMYSQNASLYQNNLHIDLQKGSCFSPWYQVFAIWIPDTLKGEKALSFFQNVLSYAKEQEKKYEQHITFVGNKEQSKKAEREGKCAAILAVEGGSLLASNAKSISQLAKQGVKVITLTWNGSNELGNGCLSKDNRGLTAFGKETVRNLCRQGMVVDVSHLNEAGFWDVAALSDKPFLATHSVSAAVNEHLRNLNDCQFAQIRDRGGVVGINFCSDQLGGLDFETVYRHISHFCELDGENTVAIGTDFDGTTLTPPWNTMAVIEQLSEFLTKKGFSSALTDKILFKNAHDFFEKYVL